MSTSPRRRLPLLLAAAGAGVILAVSAPAAAFAHVNVDPGNAQAGARTTLTFSFSHGCEGSPTTALVFDIPEEVTAVTPIQTAGWTITRDMGEGNVPTQVTFTSQTPVEDGLKALVAFDARFAEDSADTDVAFPVVQLCTEGETAWDEIAEEGVDPHSLDRPAPIVAVGPVATANAHGHSHGDESEHADGDPTEAAVTEAASADAAPDVLARLLAGGALLAGVAALVVALVRGRSREG